MPNPNRLIAITLVAATAVTAAAAGVSAQEETLFRPGICLRDGAKIAGVRPVLVENGSRTPRRIRDVRPAYPSLPEGTIVSGGMWIGEALVGVDGRVLRVWPIRHVELTPPFPAFNAAMADAARQWRFTPFITKGKARPFCVTLTTIVDVQ